MTIGRWQGTMKDSKGTTKDGKGTTKDDNRWSKHTKDDKGMLRTMTMGDAEEKCLSIFPNVVEACSHNPNVIMLSPNMLLFLITP